jgi:hypothetical protein
MTTPSNSFHDQDHLDHLTGAAAAPPEPSAQLLELEEMVSHGLRNYVDEGMAWRRSQSTGFTNSADSVTSAPIARRNLDSPKTTGSGSFPHPGPCVTCQLASGP